MLSRQGLVGANAGRDLELFRGTRLDILARRAPRVHPWGNPDCKLRSFSAPSLTALPATVDVRPQSAAS
jgi:hypothetical protein